MRIFENSTRRLLFPYMLILLCYNFTTMIYVNLVAQTMLFIGVRGFITGRPYFNAPAAGGR